MTAPRTTLVRAAVALAGPLLIVACVLLVLRGFAFGGRVTYQHPDILALWLPTNCFLGESIRSLDVPAWNPYLMGGAPFAADPQSGWLYLPAMGLFTVLSCDVAIRWFIVVQPILGGLGIYLFLRSEGLGRVCATTGGLTLGLILASSRLGLSMPLAGALVWTALLLAAASRCVRAASSPRRVLWMLAVAIAWGQVAAAHASNGLVLGTAALATYLVRAARRRARAGTLSMRSAAGWGAALVVVLPLVNLGLLLPRLAYLPETTVWLGYERLEALGATLAGAAPAAPWLGPVLDPAWPLALARSPGTYCGWIALALASAGLWRGPRASLARTFLVFGAASYLLTLEPTARALALAARVIPFGDFYLHDPTRLAYGVLLVIPILVGIGLEAFIASSRGRRTAMIVIGGAPWIIAAAASADRYSGPAAILLGAAIGAPVLGFLSGRRVVFIIPILVAAEIGASALVGQTRASVPGPSGADRAGRFAPLYEPTVDAAAYVDPGPIARRLRREGGRYVAHAPEALASPGGCPAQVRDDLLASPPRGPSYADLQCERMWGLLANQRSLLFRIEDVQASTTPVQPRRYWEFVRAVDPKPSRYNASFIRALREVTMKLFDVRWVVAAHAAPLPANATPVEEEQPWTLFELRPPGRRASVHTSWKVVESPSEARAAVTQADFDAAGDLVLEADPGIAPSGIGGGAAELRSPTEERVVVDVATTTDAVVLVRVPYDDGWHATVDGRTAKVLPADFVMQAVAVPAGRHRIELVYDDATVGYGLAGSLAAVAMLLGAAGLLARRRPPR